MFDAKFFIYLAVMAGVTYLIRMIPLVLFKKKITNKFFLSLLHYIPYAVLSAMTVPAAFFATDHILSAVIGVLFALILAYKNKSLIIVAAGATVGVLLTELIYLMV
ncbi:MAG: AzlD domain-containing protein [Clostridia bacterium]|nr:AzlD domain-containing protein [Clostridia bacterium]